MGSLGKHWKLSEVTKQKMSKSQKGRKSPLKGKKRPPFSRKWLENMSKASKGRISPNKGKKASPETRKKQSLSRIGKKWSAEIKKKISLSHGGTGTSDRTSKRYYHLLDNKYKEWRSAVFQRDNWICQTCGTKSSEGNQVYLEPHHIKGWAKYENLRYEINNGITLCRECHKLTRKKSEY